MNKPPDLGPVPLTEGRARLRPIRPGRRERRLQRRRGVLQAGDGGGLPPGREVPRVPPPAGRQGGHRQELTGGHRTGRAWPRRSWTRWAPQASEGGRRGPISAPTTPWPPSKRYVLAIEQAVPTDDPSVPEAITTRWLASGWTLGGVLRARREITTLFEIRWVMMW